MAYENTLPTVGQLKKVAGKTKTELDKLALEQKVLEARMDTQVTATTDADADYAAEVADGRVDTWANEHGSLGASIRGGQQRIAQGLQQVQESHQEQIDKLANAMLEDVAGVAESLETRRLETSNEEETRIEKDAILQEQIDKLSNAILEITTLIAEMREQSRTTQEE
ncbi:MAG: hypothetical protein IJ587_12390 [Synergistaceae bacterium]|nr:hypothetical protein [Synergistaceae bacterium]